MMDSREEFDKWIKSLEKPITGMQTGKLNEYRSQMCLEVWQACQAMNDKRIAELEEKLRVAREVLSEIIENDDSAYYVCEKIAREALKTIEA